MFRSVNLVINLVLTVIGLFMGLVAIAVLAGGDGPQNKTEWVIGLMSLSSCILLLVSAYKGFRKEKELAANETAASAIIAKKFKDAVDDTSSPITLELEPAPINMGDHHLYVRWLYPAVQWKTVMQKLTEKTRKEEIYTAVWFPVLFAAVFLKSWYIGMALGIAMAFFYVRFRVYFVAKKFGLPAANTDAEIIITNAYLRINGNFIHYADGKYYVKDMALEHDASMGELLHFTIGWVTTKNYPASMDLYLPIPDGKTAEAEMTLQAYQKDIGR